MCRILLMVVAIAAVLLSAASDIAAQDVTFAALPGNAAANSEILAFSKDGRLLREVVPISSADAPDVWHARAITYVAATGKVLRVWDLQAHTLCLSATTDGRTLVISAGIDLPKAHVHVFLFDTNTGRTQDVPSSWFDANERDPDSRISADGRLVSAFTESGAGDGPLDAPLIVSVYDWPTKKLIAKQATGYPAGGGFGGGVTPDGKIEFLYSRSGSQVVDPKTGQLIVKMGTDAFRSADGAWVVEFAEPEVDDGPREVIVTNGRNGEVAAKLDMHLTDEEFAVGGRGAFCGTSGKFIAATTDSVQAFEIPSGKKIAEFATTTWQDPDAAKTNPVVIVACSFDAKRVAIRSGARLTLHNLN